MKFLREQILSEKGARRKMSLREKAGNIINSYIRCWNVFFACAAVFCLCVNASSKEEIKRERPSKLFSPSKIPLLEDPDRDTWQKPDAVLNALKIEKGQTVADIGAGSGYLTVKLSKRVGATGTVYAVTYSRRCWII